MAQITEIWIRIQILSDPDPDSNMECMVYGLVPYLISFPSKHCHSAQISGIWIQIQIFASDPDFDMYQFNLMSRTTYIHPNAIMWSRCPEYGSGSRFFIRIQILA
jgi:hypothetical protein